MAGGASASDAVLVNCSPRTPSGERRFGRGGLRVCVPTLLIGLTVLSAVKSDI
jgi:hypothetical protein